MKLNWGTGIALVYGFFAVSMIVMVFVSRKHDPGLVQKDYYNLDLNYQDHLDRVQHASALTVQPSTAFDQETKSVVVKFPEGMTATEGKAKFFRSSTVEDDFTSSLEGVNTFSVPANKFKPGYWHVELNWIANGQKYYYEGKVLIPNA